MLGFVLTTAIAALVFAAINYYNVKRKNPGTAVMQEIAEAIAVGAKAFLQLEYRLIALIVVLISILLAILVTWQTAAAFAIGTIMSTSAGWVGMRIATLANVRVSNEARLTRSLGATLKVAFQGGSVMGLSVGGFALFGLVIVYVIFGKLMGQAEPAAMMVHKNWLGISDIPFTMTVSGYALGCSIIAMFNRVGGGIYTKAADMGADLVGKTEAGIPEDDPRNPATIADNVGDNVGDVAGLGSDLLESFVGSIISAVVLAAFMAYSSTKEGQAISPELVSALIKFPLFFAAAGLLSCIIGILLLVVKKVSDRPHRELNITTWVSAFLTILAGALVSWQLFKGYDLSSVGFALGILSPWLAAVLGISSGILIGQLAEYYTSYSCKPTLTISTASREGTALTITQGLAVGMTSVFFPVIVLALAIMGAYSLAGLYGVSMAAIGMLSFVSAIVSVDTYGPIADNAGGISEMSRLDGEVREITDELDSVGNTTAAIGKGFAIGSAAFAALSLFAAYLYAESGENIDKDFRLVLNIVQPMTLAGTLVGTALPWLFSGILIEAVAKAARAMVEEVRRQFREFPGILAGSEKPDYKTCITISSAGALREMRFPAFISVFLPLASGFLFGSAFVGGLLIGTTLSAIVLALFTANSGGAWDNAKKYIETGHYGGKGSESHKAAVIGDTVGDPLKDTVGPSLDILIKIMATVSLIAVSIFSKYNLVALLK